MVMAPLQRGQQHHRDNGKVQRVVEIVIVIIACYAVTIVVDNDKMPEHW